MGKLIYRYGSMKSGKSLNLLSVNHNYTKNGVKVLIFKSSLDTRHKTQITTRLSDDLFALAHIFDNNSNLEDEFFEISRKEKKDYEIVLVDEAQFLNKNQAIQLARLAYVHGLIVICFGLKVDFRGLPFEGSSHLMAMASSIEELKTICEVCGEHKALFPMLYIDGKLQRDGRKSNVLIDSGDTVKYVQVCGKCYFKILDEETFNQISFEL